jgi:hypothetical protein
VLKRDNAKAEHGQESEEKMSIKAKRRLGESYGKEGQ